MVLQTLGLTKNEIADWYYQRVDIPAFIKEQRIKPPRKKGIEKPGVATPRVFRRSYGA